MTATKPKKTGAKTKKTANQTQTKAGKGLRPRRSYSLMSSAVTLLAEDEFQALGGFDPNVDYLGPANGSNITWSIRLGYSDGKPAPGVTVTASRRAETLVGANWRTVNGLVSRWPAPAAQRLRERIQQGLVRLEARFDKPSAVTNSNGEASFTIEAWHVCGDESLCGSDRITLSWQGGSKEIVLRCGMPGLVTIPNEPSNGLTVTGSGYFVQSVLIATLRAVGQAWRDTKGKPPGMPNHFAITDGSIRWGGLKPPHLTHRFGGSIDARPISTDGQPTSVGAANYSREGTKILIDYFHQTGATEIRFADNLPYVTAVDASHSNHLHISWLTDPTEPWALPPVIAKLMPKSVSMRV